MRLTVILATVCALASASLFAAAPTCTTGTLASYIALGANGCIYRGVVFANFSYSGKSSGDAPIMKADQVTVTPLLIVPSTAKLNFSAPWKVESGETQDSTIKYTALLPCSTTQPVELDLALGSGHVDGIIGSATVSETTNVGDLTVFERCADLCQIKLTNALQFKPVSVVLITDNVSLNGGTGGASLEEFGTDLNLCIPCV